MASIVPITKVVISTDILSPIFGSVVFAMSILVTVQSSSPPFWAKNELAALMLLRDLLHKRDGATNGVAPLESAIWSLVYTHALSPCAFPSRCQRIRAGSIGSYRQVVS